MSQELEFLVLGSLVLESQELESLVLGSQELESQELESQELESQVLESQGLCHQLQLLKQRPKQPNTGPKPGWELEAFPLSGLALGAFLATVSVLEVFLELAFPLQPRQPPQPRQPRLVLQGPWEDWCQVPQEQYPVCQSLEGCQEW